jgi:hypothetical protein
MESLIELLRSKKADKFPKYISNKELMEFLNENKEKVDKENFLELVDFYNRNAQPRK